MVTKPRLTTRILLAASLILSAAFFLAGFPLFFLVLVVPLFPLLNRNPAVRRCPV